jgi:glycosyltransferase involved in cell wall biosynthesis
MRITILTPSLDVQGGATRKILKIAQHFDARIYTLDYDPEKTFEGFRDLDVIVPKKGIFGKILGKPVDAARYFHSLKLEDYDIVNAHLEPSEFARNRNSPMIWYCYSPYRFAYDRHDWMMERSGMGKKLLLKGWTEAFRRMEGDVVPKIERIITNSTNVQARIRKYLHRDSDVLYSGVDSDSYSCKGQERFFFYPSRIDPLKDFAYAIRAFRIFSRKHKGWKLVIAGSLSWVPDHRRYLEELKSQCDGSVVIETSVSEERIRDLYSRCYTVLYSPIDEDFGMIPLEAMASSKPCIARNEGGPRETVAHGVDGFLVDSPEDMAQRMDALAKDPELCQRMGKAGRAKVVRDYRWEIFLERFGGMAQEVADTGSRDGRGKP